MSHLPSCPWPLVLALVLATCPSARGQVFPTDDDPFDKARARGLREARPAETAPLKRALRDAAVSGYAARFERVQKGTDTPDVVLGLLRKLLAADLALADGPAARLAARQRYWAGLREVEVLTRDRVDAGIRQITLADVWTARSERLLGELSLMHELAAAGKPLPGCLHTALNDPDPLATRAVARDELAASRATERELAEAARDACVNDTANRIQRIRAGSDTPDMTLAILPRRLAAEKALGKSPSDLLAALEGLWQIAWDCESLTKHRVEIGIQKFTQADYLDARAARLAEAVLIAEVRQQPGKPLQPRGNLQDRSFVEDDPRESGEAGRVRGEDMRAEARQLAGRRRETLLDSFSIHLQRMRAGSDTPYVTSATSRQLLDVELILAGGKKAERLAALSRYLTRAAEIEGYVKERVESGTKRFAEADVWEARFDRLQAELWIAEARAARE